MNGWRVGVSAVGLSLAEIVSRVDDPPGAALQRWRDSRGLDFLLVMSAHATGGPFQRELGTSARGDAAVALLPTLVRLSSSVSACRCCVSPLARQVSALSSSELTLVPLPLPPPGWPQPGVALSQKDVKASRKVVQPLLVQFFAGNAK